MNKDQCRDVDRSPGYYNSGSLREITNLMNLGMLISNLGTSPQTVGEVTNVSDADSISSLPTI